MDFGVVFQLDPPASEVIRLAQRAEAAGFSHVWSFDSHLLWQEPFVIYSQILATTSSVMVGPMVTNPGTRDATVTASMFATLNSMYGNRTICGIGRGDSALRTVGAQPKTIAELREYVRVVRELANGRTVHYRGVDLRFPWITDSQLDIWVAAYGPKVLAVAGEVGDGYILQLADPDIAAWMIEAVRAAAQRAGRDPGTIKFCVTAPAYVGDDLAHQRDQTRWFGGMVGNHISDIVSRYGHRGNAVPQVLSDYIAGRTGYDYASHGRAGNPHADFVPDEIIDRFCVLGPVENHLARLQELRNLGVDHFAIYLQHDAKEATLDAYAESIVPEFAGDLTRDQS
jgi:probable F420-dependent oxidoreductase